MNILLAPATYKSVTVAAGGHNVLERGRERYGQYYSAIAGGLMYSAGEVALNDVCWYEAETRKRKSFGWLV